MERIAVSTVTRQFKRTFDEGMLNELGKRTRLCQRERTVTPFRLALSLIEVFASPRVPCIADLHRGFNALCEESERWSQLFRQFLSVISGSLPPLVRLPVVWTVG